MLRPPPRASPPPPTMCTPLLPGDFCPDCRRSTASIRAEVQAVGGSLTEVDCGERTEWKSERHPLRQEPMLLKNIPTLVAWGSDGPLDRIGEKKALAPKHGTQGDRTCMLPGPRQPTNPWRFVDADGALETCATHEVPALVADFVRRTKDIA